MSPIALENVKYLKALRSDPRALRPQSAYEIGSCNHLSLVMIPDNPPEASTLEGRPSPDSYNGSHGEAKSRILAAGVNGGFAVGLGNPADTDEGRFLTAAHESRDAIAGERACSRWVRGIYVEGLEDGRRSGS